MAEAAEAAPLQTLSGLLLTAQLLIVVAAALVTSRERLGHVDTGILTLEVFDLSRHLAHHLIIFFAPCPGVQR